MRSYRACCIAWYHVRLESNAEDEALDIIKVALVTVAGAVRSRDPELARHLRAVETAILTAQLDLELDRLAIGALLRVARAARPQGRAALRRVA